MMQTEDNRMSNHLSQEEIREMRRDIAEIKLAVIGDSSLGIKPMPKRIEILEMWKDKVNLRVATLAGIISGASFGGLELIKALLTKLTHL